MITTIIFDMYETLVTHYQSRPYFGKQMASDIGIPEERFLAIWQPAEGDRSTGKITLEALMKFILRETDHYSEDLCKKLVEKRVASEQQCFLRLHPEIMPLLNRLKKKGMKLGLISNCFSEEAKLIRESSLFPYFDAVALSYEEGLKKPDPEIFSRCMKKLGVKPEECLYVADGDNQELEAARKLDMNVVQAVWYFPSDMTGQLRRKSAFCQVEQPLDVIHYLNLSKANTFLKQI